METKENNKRLLIIVGALLLVVGVSLAYFISNTLINGNGASTKVTTAKIKGATINVEGVLSFEDLNILPGHKSVSGIKITPTGSETILDNITVNTGTPNFANAATTDEGVFKVEDGMYGGYSYYWRGAVNNNYVKFGGFCWRIIRINGDKTMRLIYDGATCHQNGTEISDNIAVEQQGYNWNFNRSEYVGYTYTIGLQRTTGGTASNLKTQNDAWYNNSNLSSYDEKIVDGKFCNDREVEAGSTWSLSPSSSFNYAAQKRLYTDYAPSLSCNAGDVYTLKVGLITADEAMYAGGKNADNTSYYLYNGQHYWAMSE